MSGVFGLAANGAPESADAIRSPLPNAFPAGAPLRVLLVARRLDPARREPTVNLIKALVARGLTVGLATDEPASAVAAATAAGARVEPTSPARTSAPYTLVHALHSEDAAPAASLARAWRVPCLHSQPDPIARWPRLLWQVRPQPVLVPSLAVRTSFTGSPAAGHPRVHLLAPPVDTTRLTPAAAPSSTTPAGVDTVVVLGEARADRRLEDAVLAAWPAVQAGRPGAKLVLAGADPAALEEARMHAQRHRAADFSVQLIQSLDAAVDTCRAASLVVALGQSALHAMALGIPALTHDDAGRWRAISPGNFDSLTSHLFGAHARPAQFAPPALLAHQVRLVLDDLATARILAAGNARLVHARHGLTATGEKLEQIYRRLLES